MAEFDQNRIWVARSLFLLFGLFIIFFRILPLETGTPGLPGPDFILCFALAWIVRQPETVPMWAILFLILLSDFLLQRPPGLWTALALMACEAARNRRALLTESPFLFEWALISGIILLMVLAQRLILWILIVEQPNLGLSLMEGLATIVIYPLVVLVSRYGLGMVKMPLVDAEA